MKAHTPVYRPILKHALETAWTHRELWPIAAVAGLAGTGAVVNDVLNQAKLAAALPTTDFSRTFENLHILKVYQDNLIFASPEQITVGTLILAAIAILIVLAIAASQQIMLRVAHKATVKKTRVELKEIRHELAHPRLFRFLGLDLLLKLMVANLMIATTVLVSNLNVAHVVSDAFFGGVFSIVAFCLALTLNVLVMLSLIGVARKDLGFSAAIGYAWNLYRTHWFICLEMSVILFAANFLISAAYDGTILALGVPAALSFLAALETGSLLAYVSVVTIVAVVVVAITLAFAGFATTFTYTAWIALAEKLDKRAITPRVVAHGSRFIDTFLS
ncbi:MAG TPA: hypothetical protein PLK06_00860 [bacterium]|nr:hypothetical protein [bacterium]